MIRFHCLFQTRLSAVITCLLMLPVLAYANTSQSLQLKLPQLAPDAVLMIQSRPFDPARAQLNYCKARLCAIDGKPFWGSDGAIPKREICAMELIIQGSKIPLQIDGMMDSGLTQDNLHERFQAHPIYPGMYQLTGQFSDGAGAYIAQWYLTEKGATRTFIGNREALFELANPP